MSFVVCYVVTVVGIVLAWGMVVFIFVTNRKQYKAAQRLGYKLYAWIGLMDFLNNLMGLVGYDSNFDYGMYTAFSMNAGIYYTADTFQSICNTSFITLTACMAYNLHMVFLKRKYTYLTHDQYAKWAIGLSSVLPALQFAIALYGSRTSINKAVGGKWEGWGYIEDWVVYYLWQMLGLGYCFYVFVNVVLRLRKNRIRIANLAKLPTPDGSTSVTMEQFASRLILYALVPLITQPSVLILRYFDGRGITFFVVLLSNLSALLNALCFLLDPALKSILLEWKVRRASKNQPQVPEETPNTLIWRM